MLSEVVELQKDYVSELCSRCEDPCCNKVHYLFCEKDILFLKVSGRKSKWKREAFKKKGCWFLSSTGCILDSKSRPFICHRYICPDLEDEIKKRDPHLLHVLEEKFKVIDEMRSQLWAEYLEDRMKGENKVREKKG